MANVSQFSTSASSNDQAPPDGAPEGWSPSDANNWGRELMAALARWYQDTQGSLVTAGTGNAYTLASNSSHAALADQSVLVFRVDRANTGAATLAVDGLAAKSLVKADGSALASDDLQANSLAAVAYNANQDKYFLLSPTKLGTAATKGSASTTAEGTVELATNAEAQTGTDTARAVTPAGFKSGLDARNASESATGLAEIATQAETDDETDDTRFVTPKKLGAWASTIGIRFFESSSVAFTDNDELEFVHGLDNAPKIVQVWLECVGSQNGWSIGDKICINGMTTGGASDFGAHAYADAAKIYVIVSGNGFALGKPGQANPGDWTAVSNANFKLFVRAFG